MEYADMMARDMHLAVPGDPYRTFFALTRLANECAAEVRRPLGYESAVRDSRSSPSGRDRMIQMCHLC